MPSKIHKYCHGVDFPQTREKFIEPAYTVNYLVTLSATEMIVSLERNIFPVYTIR